MKRTFSMLTLPKYDSAPGRTARLGLLLFVGLGAGVARAEGSAELGSHRLDPGTVLSVDVFDSGSERLSWVGTGALTVLNPDGSVFGTYQSPAAIALPASGLYSAVVEIEQETWDLAVVHSGQSRPGRLSSREWRLVPRPAWAPNDLHFYAAVPTGTPNHWAAVDVDFRGFGARKGYVVRANQVGRPGPHPNGSAPVRTPPPAPEHPLYLNPPERATDPVSVPSVSSDRISPDSCPFVVPGLSEVSIEFVSNVEGAWHLTCDLSRDGVFDVSGGGDVTRTGRARIGTNVAIWDGLDARGQPSPTGDVACEVTVTTGTMFLFVRNPNTIFPGFRMYQRASVLVPLRMYWDDSEIQAADLPMPKGAPSRMSSGPEGVLSGPPTSPPSPNVDARALGNFGGRGKGSETDIGTFTWLASDNGQLITVAVVNDSDRDLDLLRDSRECTIGTSPTSPDTDGDGLGDFAETDGGELVDTDFDGRIDALDLDSDADGRSDLLEGSSDLDADALVNFRDPDDDGDGVSTATELTLFTDPLGPDSDGDGLPDGVETDWGLAVDSDGDGRIDALDLDSDDDTVEDGEEGSRDLDSDHVPNYRDDDDDDDGIPTATESSDGSVFGADVDGDSRRNEYDRNSDGDAELDREEGVGDEDADGIPNYLDREHTPMDSDGDTLADEVEARLGTDPFDADSDGDGLSDSAELADLSPTRRDRSDTDPLDADTDDDGLSDGEELVAGVDAELTDPLDPDTDADQLGDGLESGVFEPVASGTSASGIAFDGTARGFQGDADPGTRTSPTDVDSDDGSVSDGVEDANLNGRVDPGERDPGFGSDDLPALCGNGMSDVGEMCDDGNTRNGDGCSDLCTLEPGHACVGRVCGPADDDDDGVPDDTDNCAGLSNRSQLDEDRDHIGDDCDEDQDGDGFPDDVKINGGGCRTIGGFDLGALAAVWLVGLVLRRRKPT
ncbi:MAG: hypothetical protein HYV07_17550 [Deltaproteobacteria bacterium]|nr:hypothetical protein [Deltaproteobacteria bacterium]